MERTPAGKPAQVVKPAFGHPEDPFAELSSVLWRERELLERLLYCLTTQRLVLASNGGRWLATSDRFVAAAADALREQGLLRAIATEGVLHDLELPSSSSLAVLAAHAAEPWPAILSELQVAMSELTTEIDAAVTANEQLVLASIRTAAQ